MFGVPEADLDLLPADLDGALAVEVGCGTGYVSAWLARRGAQVVGIDPTRAQLRSAVANQSDHDLVFPLVEAAGEAIPLRTASADLVISEYGAALWADPSVWIPEAARVLRPGGRLVSLSQTPLLVMCSFDDGEIAADDRLKRPLFGMGRIVWPDADATEHTLPHGEMIDLLVGSGFRVDRLVEIPVPADAETSYPHVDSAWASRWPVEEVWIATRLSRW